MTLEISVTIDVDSTVFFHIETFEAGNTNKIILGKVFHILKMITM